MTSRVVTVFGSGNADEGDAVFDTAMSLGRGLAEAGFALANGGYGGTMLAAATGTNQAGGKVVDKQIKATLLMSARDREHYPLHENSR